MALKFIDLFAGMGGFHRALAALGHECVFASESDDELRRLYVANFRYMDGRTFGDIREAEVKRKIPDHQVLCAGFPCQPFSKSGDQRGLADLTRGTLFHEIIEIVRSHKPEFVILENVGNFERHDNGRTWKIVRESLERLGYSVRGTLHVNSGGHGLLSPHHLGCPHNRERFFIAARLSGPVGDPFPPRRKQPTSLRTIMQRPEELDERDRQETRLSPQQRACIEHWNALLKALPAGTRMPFAPIWGDEFGATYPYKDEVPARASTARLRQALGLPVTGRRPGRDKMLQLLPSYARAREFQPWKVYFIEQNRTWYEENKEHFPAGWLEQLRNFPPSLRKLEWNCHGEKLDLWRCVLQFRPSGLRAKRMTASPSLVAMTTTQIPVIGPARRFVTRVEGLRLQGFPDTHRLPDDRETAFRALGNAVHVAVVLEIAKRLVGGSESAVMQLELNLNPPVAKPLGDGLYHAPDSAPNSHDEHARTGRDEDVKAQQNGRVAMSARDAARRL